MFKITRLGNFILKKHYYFKVWTIYQASLDSISNETSTLSSLMFLNNLTFLKSNFIYLSWWHYIVFVIGWTPYCFYFDQYALFYHNGDIMVPGLFHSQRPFYPIFVEDPSDFYFFYGTRFSEASFMSCRR